MECANTKAPIRLQFDSWELVAYNTIQDNEMRGKALKGINCDEFATSRNDRNGIQYR